MWVLNFCSNAIGVGDSSPETASPVKCFLSNHVEVRTCPFFPPCESQEVNSSHQAGQQVPLTHWGKTNLQVICSSSLPTSSFIFPNFFHILGIWDTNCQEANLYCFPTTTKKKKTYVPFIASESLSIYKVQVIKVLAVFLWYVYPSIVQISNPERWSGR